jgi:AraC-like DNA-binding protein
MSVVTGKLPLHARPKEWQNSSLNMADRLTSSGQARRAKADGPSASAARELATIVRDLGEDLPALFRRAALPVAPEHLLDPDWRGGLSREAFARLYAECTWILDGHAARQEGRAPMSKPEIELLAYCVMGCATLEEVIARAAIFSTLAAPRMAPLTLTTQAGVAEFRMATLRTRRNRSAFVSDLTGLSMYHRLFGWLTGQKIELLEVHLSYPPLLSEEAAAWLMPYPITYGAPDNLLRFSAHYLGQHVVRSYSELVPMLKRFPFDLEEPQSLSGPVSERVGTLLTAALARGGRPPQIADLARQFNMSAATLKRRLADEGTSVRRLHAAGVRDLAFRLLSDGSGVRETAARLGFSDPASFTRAFRRWTGSSPSSWRRRQGSPPPAAHSGVRVPSS